MPGLLYPAYQKFYSAICCLERFNKESNFFDNIACLDSFLSEYRSVTLVLQKSLAHTIHIDKYKELVSSGIFDSWLNDQRVKSVHTHPVEYTKQIQLTIYFPDCEVSIGERNFTVENDEPLNELLDSVKEFFSKLHLSEIFFSAKFSFYEKDTGEDLLKKLTSGVDTMKMFLELMDKEVGEQCKLCDQLKNKIDECKLHLLPAEFFMINDYAFYPKTNEFIRADKLGLFVSDHYTKSPLSGLNRISSNPRYTNFQKFIMMNVSIGTTDLMPTIMNVYTDDTFSFNTFHSNLKTVMYRKINETAELVRGGTVKEVYVMMTYLYYEIDQSNYHERTSRERQNNATVEYLTFMKIDSDLNQQECVFEGTYIQDPKYIVDQFNNIKNKLDLGIKNMMPIIQAFMSIKK